MLELILAQIEKLIPERYDLKIERSWRQDKQSRIFLPEYRKAA